MPGDKLVLGAKGSDVASPRQQLRPEPGVRLEYVNEVFAEKPLCVRCR